MPQPGDSVKLYFPTAYEEKMAILKQLLEQTAKQRRYSGPPPLNILKIITARNEACAF